MIVKCDVMLFVYCMPRLWVIAATDLVGWMRGNCTKPTSDLDAFVCPPSHAVVEGPPKYSNQAVVLSSKLI